ncbi:MAG: cellulose binding domain-containing protein [Planctomycetes bacterium]|nr:cellulose binding domain-containing protein [Planctomycetota bacterium]
MLSFSRWLDFCRRVSAPRTRRSGRRSTARVNRPCEIETLEVRSLLAGGVSVGWSITNDWGTGFQAQVQLNNSQTTSVSNWQLAFDYAPNISSIWDAVIVSHTGSHYVIKGATWNSNLPAAGNVTFGFVANGASTSSATNFTLNGTAIGNTTSAPTLSIADSSISESLTQTVTEPFVVTLSAPATSLISVDYTTVNGTATAGTNYQATKGTLVFNPGQTQQTIKVNVLSAPTAAAATTYQLTLSNPKGATLSRNQATGTILNPAAKTTGKFQFRVTSDWGSGFTGEITATNTGTTAINNWQMGFDFPGQITSIWNASVVSHIGNHYVIQNAGWNSSIASGASVTIGFNGSPGNVTTGPTNYAFLGQQSGGTGGTGGTNQVPTPANDTVFANMNQTTVINVLANDTDPNGDTLTVTAVTAALNGTAVLKTDGSVSYTPKSTFAGADSFTYTVSDGHGGTAKATVKLTVGTPSSSAAWPAQYYAPYVDMTLYPTYDLVAAAATKQVKYFTLAFIVSDANQQPAWGGYTEYEVNGGTFDAKLRQQIANLRAAGGDVMVSFGGAANRELAETITSVSQLTTAYQTVINAYNSTHLDFDIEGAAVADRASVDRRSQALATLQKNAAALGQTLQIWLTLPVIPSGLTADGLYVVQSALKYGVQLAGVNVMTMDYGESAAPNPAGQMGTYAIESATSVFGQLQKLYGSTKTSAQLWGMIGVTPMIGVNDDTNEVFDLNAARQLLAFVEQQGLGRISIWSLNRDTASTTSKTYVDTTSSSIVQSELAFSSIFETLMAGVG